MLRGDMFTGLVNIEKLYVQFTCTYDFFRGVGRWDGGKFKTKIIGYDSSENQI